MIIIGSTARLPTFSPWQPCLAVGSLETGGLRPKVSAAPAIDTGTLWNDKHLAVIVVSQRLNGIKPAQPALTFKTLSFS